MQYIPHKICAWLSFDLFPCGHIIVHDGFMHSFNYIHHRVASLALGQSYDCPSASEATLKDMGKICHPLIITKHNKVGRVQIIHGLYSMYQFPVWITISMGQPRRMFIYCLWELTLCMGCFSMELFNGLRANIKAVDGASFSSSPLDMIYCTP